MNESAVPIDAPRDGAGTTGVSAVRADMTVPATSAPTDTGCAGRSRAPGTAAPSRKSTLIKLASILIAAVALGLCVVTLVREWGTISSAVAAANLPLLVLALVTSAAGMFALSLLWRASLVQFGSRLPVSLVSSWFFAGELGKYIPGGVWPVLGRGELSRREGGVPRSVAYTTTLLSMGLMCVGAAVVCGVLAPFLTTDGGKTGPVFLLLLLIPAGMACMHPAVVGRVFGLARRVSKGRIDMVPLSWSKMLTLTAKSLPTWLLIGAAADVVTWSLGYSFNPARIAFAAIAAWILGFLAVPVPAGAGVREVVFVAASGLATGPAIAVAAVARLLLIVVDAVGGVSGLLAIRVRRGRVAPVSTENH